MFWKSGILVKKKKGGVIHGYNRKTLYEETVKRNQPNDKHTVYPNKIFETILKGGGFLISASS